MPDVVPRRVLQHCPRNQLINQSHNHHCHQRHHYDSDNIHHYTCMPQPDDCYHHSHHCYHSLYPTQHSTGHTSCVFEHENNEMSGCTATTLTSTSTGNRLTCRQPNACHLVTNVATSSIANPSMQDFAPPSAPNSTWTTPLDQLGTDESTPRSASVPLEGRAGLAGVRQVYGESASSLARELHPHYCPCLQLDHHMSGQCNLSPQQQHHCQSLSQLGQRLRADDLVRSGILNCCSCCCYHNSGSTGIRSSQSFEQTNTHRQGSCGILSSRLARIGDELDLARHSQSLVSLY
ncbi:unnamed protein product [Protopolystoma xenopodis]|uniref:Uncharacterized protein n=1 Tax=Protopolystoma xenopodis TaxID=117903 RepID=A0A448WS79_9PLAT|nr:unnamed protein product [Protopolystoma xenopodis]